MKFKTRPKGLDADFLKIEAGQSVEGVFRGDPVDFYQHWPKGGEKSICSGSGCPSCAAGVKRNFRFLINFVMKENAAYVAKVWEQSGTVYDDMRGLHESGYDLEKTVVRITRKGNGKDTTYHIVPKPDGKLTPATEKAIAAVKLNELGQGASESTPAREPGEDAQEEAPF